MGNDGWVKRIHLMTKGQSKWLRICRRLVNKCELRINVVNNGPGVEIEWIVRSLLGESRNWTMSKWHNVVIQNVREYGLQQWKKGMTNKKTL